MKNIAPKVITNTGIQFTGRVMQAFLGLFTTALLAIALGTNGYRDYSLIATYAAFFGAFTDLGLIRILMREVSQVQPETQKNKQKSDRLSKKIITTGLSLNVSITLILFFFFALFIFFTGYRNELKIAIIIGFIGEGFASLRMAETILRVRMKMIYVSLSLLFSSLLTFLTALSLSHINGSKILWFAIGWSLSHIISYVLIFIFANRELFLFPIKLKLNLALKLLKESWPYGLAVILGMIYFRIDVLMIDKIMGKDQTSFYTAAYKFVDIVIALPAFFITASLPVLANRYKTHPQKFKTAYHRAMKFLIMISLPLSIILFTVAPQLIKIVFPDEFSESITILRLLALTFPFIFLANLYGALLVILKRNYAYLFMSSAGAVLNIIINFFLIRHWAAKGAAIATLITEIIILIISYILTVQRLKVSANRKDLVKIALCAFIIAVIIMAVSIYLTDRDISLQNYLSNHITSRNISIKLSYLIQIVAIAVVGISSYILLLISFKIFGKNELRSIIKKKS